MENSEEALMKTVESLQDIAHSLRCLKERDDAKRVERRSLLMATLDLYLEIENRNDEN